VKTNPELGLTERAATRIIDLLLDKPGVTDESRRSPDSVMSFEPRAFAPATVAASAASAASAAAIVAAAAPPNDHGLRRVPRLRPNIGPHSAPRSAPATAPRTQPFLPIGAPVGVPRSASAMGREPPPPFESRHGLRVSHLAVLPLDDGRRLAASRRALWLASARQLHAAVLIVEPYAAEHDASPARDAHCPSIGLRRPRCGNLLKGFQPSKAHLLFYYRLKGVINRLFFFPCLLCRVLSCHILAVCVVCFLLHVHV
jgi:hypothetical protein